MLKNQPANVGNSGLIPGPGRFPGERNGNPLQFSCLEKPLGQRSLVGWSSWRHRHDLETDQQQQYVKALGLMAQSWFHTGNVVGLN